MKYFIALEGGGLNSSTKVPATLVNGRLYANIPGKKRQVKAFLGNHVKMVEYIRRLRNEKTHELMLAEGDPNDVQGDGSLRLPKRDLFDMIPPTLTLDVETTSSILASVNVLTPPRTKAMLQIEATQHNMELLLEEPKKELWTATIAHEQKNVYWIASKGLLGCERRHSKLKKWRSKKLSAEISSSMDDSDKHDAIMKTAGILQSFYDSNHNLEKNMPADMCKRKRDRGSDDGASAESAHGEPVQKALK